MSMKKRLADIVTRFRIDGSKEAAKAMSDVSGAASKAAQATSKMGGSGVASVAGAAGAASGALDNVRDSAVAAKRAIDEISAKKIAGKNLDLGVTVSGKDAAASASAFQDAFADTQRKVAATSLAGVDTSKIAPGIDKAVLERALKAARQAAGDGVPIDVYVDPTSLVRVEKDVLKALDDVTPTVDFGKVDKGALKRAGAAMSAALASGMKLDQFVDAQTKTAFSGEQLQELARTGFGAGEALEEVADAVKDVDKAIDRVDPRPIAAIDRQADGATKGFRQLASGATSVVRGLGAVARAGTSMGGALTKALRSSTTLIKGLATSAAGLAASKGLSVGAASGFALNAGRDTVERYRQTRNIAALTGMSPQMTEFWERYGAGVGLEGTDLGQVFSGFIASIRDAQDVESPVGKIFAELKVGLTDKDSGLNKSIIAEDSAVSKMFGFLVEDAEDANKAIRSTSDVFVEFLTKIQKLDPQKRGGYLTQVFGEDDALKVAELAEMVARDGGRLKGQMAGAAAAGVLISDRELAQVKRYQVATLQLGNAWDVFKRKLFSALEPIMTGYARFFQAQIFKNSGAVIQRFFVRPVFAASRAFYQFLLLFDRTRGFRNFRGQLANTTTVLYNILFVVKELATLFARGFLPTPSGAEQGYVAFLNAVDRGLVGIRRWIHESGPAAVAWTRQFARDLFALAAAGAAVFTGLARGLDEILLNRGIDWRSFFAPEQIAAAAQGVVRYFGALWRDVSRLMSGQVGFLETRLGKLAVIILGKIQGVVREIGPAIRVLVDKMVKGVQDRFQALVGPIIAYLQTAWREFSEGLALEDMTTRLGQLLSVLASVGEYVVDLAKAFRDVIVLGKQAPEGLRWLETVNGILGRIGGAVTTLFNSLKPVLSAIDSVLAKLGLWDTATIALAGLIVAKVAAAFGVSVVGAIGAAIAKAKILAGILGLGGAGAAAGAAAGGAAAGAAGGAAAAGATGGILAGIAAIGTTLGQVLLRFTPIIGVLSGITAGAYALLQQLDGVTGWVDKLGGMLGLKTKADVETDMTAIRASLNSAYANAPRGRTGASNGGAANGNVDRGFVDVGGGRFVGVPNMGDMLVPGQVYESFRGLGDQQRDPVGQVNLFIGGENLKLRGTQSEIDAMLRNRAVRLGRS